MLIIYITSFLRSVPSTLFSTECTEYCDKCDPKNISLMMAIHDTFPDQGRRNPVMIRPKIKVLIDKILIKRYNHGF